jgi:fructokinase
MRKVIGIGETILDIIFQEIQPRKAVPGGSTFNCMVSLGRYKVPALFISELGNDKVGTLIRDFMHENNLSTEYIDFYDDGSSPISLAFLDEKQNAEYQFFREFPEKRLQVNFPEINANDILIFSSYFAVNPELRETVSRLINEAKARKAIVYYDINFRKAHAAERLQLLPHFIENFSCSTIVRCSDEDLETLFPGENTEEIYRKYIVPYCPNFIVTRGEKDILLKTGTFEKTYPVEALNPVSTIGAGDNFNAGLIYGLLQNQITLDKRTELSETEWDKLIVSGKTFAKEVCLSMDNYVSEKSEGLFHE